MLCQKNEPYCVGYIVGVFDTIFALQATKEIEYIFSHCSINKNIKILTQEVIKKIQKKGYISEKGNSLGILFLNKPFSRELKYYFFNDVCNNYEKLEL